MIRIPFLLAAGIAVALATVSNSTVRAQDEPPKVVGSLEVVEADATKYRTISRKIEVAGFQGARGVFAAPQGKAFLVVHLSVKPIFAKNEYDDSASSAEGGAVFLEIDGKKGWSIGSCSPHGVFESGIEGYSFYDYDEVRHEGFDPVFVVPADAKAGKLTLGGVTHDLTFDGEIQEAIDPAQALALQVKETKVAGELKRSDILGTYQHQVGEFTQTIETTAGNYLLVSIVLKPKARNQANGYYGNLADFALLLGKQVYIAPIGTMSGDEFSEYSYDLGSEQDALGDFSAVQATIVYPLPGAVTTGKLLYLGKPIADLSFGK